MKKKALIVSFLIFTIFRSGFSQTDQIESFNFPKKIGCINDYEGLFTEQEIMELNEIISNYEKNTSNQVIIVSTNTYKPFETVKEYALELANYWGISQNGKSNGVIMIVDKSINKVHIEVSQGMESKLKDKEVELIIANIIIPEFKNGNYFTGVRNGVVEILKELE